MSGLRSRGRVRRAGGPPAHGPVRRLRSRLRSARGGRAPEPAAGRERGRPLRDGRCGRALAPGMRGVRFAARPPDPPGRLDRGPVRGMRVDDNLRAARRGGGRGPGTAPSFRPERTRGTPGTPVPPVRGSAAFLHGRGGPARRGMRVLREPVHPASPAGPRGGRGTPVPASRRRPARPAVRGPSGIPPVGRSAPGREPSLERIPLELRRLGRGRSAPPAPAAAREVDAETSRFATLYPAGGFAMLTEWMPGNWNGRSCQRRPASGLTNSCPVVVPT